MSENKKIKFPHVYIILLAIVLITSLLTHLIPAGKYGKIIGPNGKELIDAQSFEYVDGKGISLFEMLMSIPKGMIEVADIIFFIFIVGGAFYVVQSTGAVENGIKKLADSMKGNEKILIPILTIVFALCGGIFGMAEETLPFIPIMVALSLSLGFDSLTGAGIVLAGAGAGFAGAFLNPFTIGVAHKIAGLEIYSGLNFRIGVFCCMTTLVVVFLYRYASKVKKAPELSLVYKIDQERLSTVEIDETTDLSGSQKGVLFVFLAAIILLVYGVIQYGWGIIHIAGLFFGMGILAALVGRIGLNGFAKNFVKGMANIAEGAMVVGVARAILVVLNEG
ncbi:MAG: YfcC family protein, partial [Bacteroidetes bacterium]|nr:YfcC family protein [Bacteroidota bacterium]